MGSTLQRWLRRQPRFAWWCEEDEAGGWICGTDCGHNGTLPGRSQDISINFGPECSVDSNGPLMSKPMDCLEDAVHLICNMCCATKHLHKAILAYMPQRATSAREIVLTKDGGCRWDSHHRQFESHQLRETAPSSMWQPRSAGVASA